MVKHQKKSGNTATKNIPQRSFSFKHIYAVGLVTSGLFFGCGGDSGEPAVPTTPKTDSPTTYIFKSNGLPEGVSVDAANKVLNVPETLSDADIKKLFENGTVSDKDGGAVLKSVVLSGDKVTLTLQGKNGKTGATDTTTQTWTVKKMAITAEFPNEIVAGNSLIAGDADFFKTLFDKEFTLSDGSKAKLSKVLVNEQEVTATHIINVPETYTLQLSITKDGKEISKEYSLIVNPVEVVTNDLSGYTAPEDLKLDHRKAYQKILARQMGITQIQGILSHALKDSGKK